MGGTVKIRGAPSGHRVNCPGHRWGTVRFRSGLGRHVQWRTSRPLVLRLFENMDGGGGNLTRQRLFGAMLTNKSPFLPIFCPYRRFHALDQVNTKAQTVQKQF